MILLMTIEITRLLEKATVKLKENLKSFKCGLSILYGFCQDGQMAASSKGSDDRYRFLIKTCVALC